jgi:hypothetical protein
MSRKNCHLKIFSFFFCSPQYLFFGEIEVHFFQEICTTLVNFSSHFDLHFFLFPFPFDHFFFEMIKKLVLFLFITYELLFYFFKKKSLRSSLPSNKI